MPPEKQRVGLGLLGTGRVGRLHLNSLCRLRDKCQVIHVADPFIERHREWLEELGIHKLSSNYKDVIADPEVKAVYICTTTDTHGPLLKEAAREGKDIFCEKPIDMTLEGAEEALQVARSAGVLLQVGFNRRFDPSFANVRERYRSGEIGTVDIMRITSRDPEPPPSIDWIKSSGGLFHDMTAHDFDMCRYVAGSEIEAVCAAGAVRVDEAIGQAGDIDTCVVTLWLENGALCSIDNSREAVYGYDMRMEVFGRKGMLRALNETPTRVESVKSEGTLTDKPHYWFRERFPESMLRQAESFLDAVMTRSAPLVSGADALTALRVALAADISMREKRVVRVDEIKLSREAAS